MLKILVYPVDPNPYQELLYEQLKRHALIKYLNPRTQSNVLNLFLLIPFLIYYRMTGIKIIHLHWPKFAFTGLPKHLAYTLGTIYIVAWLMLIKLLGYKLIWTVHNIHPHERQFLDDQFITKLLVHFSSKCIVHTRQAKNQLVSLQSDVKKIAIIPHGSYISHYGNTISTSDSKKKLNIGISEFVFLFLGQIREYKGIPDLLKSFIKISCKNSSIKLIVAGNCWENKIIKELNVYKDILKEKLRVDIKRVPDDDIQIYMNAADVVVFPFRRVTTSGSLLLALSFGKPVIYPKEFFTELPDNIGYGYENVDDLPNIMENAVHDTALTQKGINAKLYADQFSWPEIAHATLAVYNSLI